MILRLLFALLLLAGVAGCQSDDTAEAEAVATETTATAATETTESGETIEGTAVDENEITTDSGLKYVDSVVGEGASPNKGDLVTVHYTGFLEDGTKFDSSVDRGKKFEFKIGLGQVIKGWDEGVMSMKVGGKRKLIIPPQLAYGSRGTGRGLIPPNATLTFDIELFDVK